MTNEKTDEIAKEIADTLMNRVKERFHLIPKNLSDDEWEEVTVKSIVLDLYDLTQATDLKWHATGSPLSVQDVQDMFYQDIENLADLLGIDLDERSN